MLLAVGNSLRDEPLPIGERNRELDSMLPVGLKNVGNTCYFNSLL